MLHTFWVTESAFERVHAYVQRRDSTELYMIHAMHDLNSMRYVVLVECSDHDATWLELIAD